MMINLKTRTIKLERCQKLNISIDVIVRTQSYFKRIIYIKFSITIISNIITKVSIAYNNIISKNRNFLFESDYA